MGSTRLRISGTSGSSLLLQANSKRVYMSVPSCDEEVFLVTAADPNSDPSFDAALLILNERFERLPPEPNALVIAIEYLLKVLQQFQTKTVSQPSRSGDYDLADSDEDHDGDNDGCVDDYLGAHEVSYGHDMACTWDASRPSSAFMELCSKGFVYAMAMEAKRQCEASRQQFRNPFLSLDTVSTNADDVLAWCIVKPNPSALSIDIKMQLGGIIQDDFATTSLGLSLDFPMLISLEFSKDLWCRVQCSSALQIVACHVKAIFDHSKNFSGETASQKSNIHVNEYWYKDKRHKFGEKVLVPELVHCFLDYLNSKDQGIAKSSDVLKELQQFTTVGNAIVGLIRFLVARFKGLPNWCISCWDTLPYKVGRLRTCDKDLCLYKFEDLGLGPTILQDVHRSGELMDFEISLAIAAASSKRDVFEPFPAILLEKEEIRGRSGWFSKKLKLNSHQKVVLIKRASCHVNKNKSLYVLKSILSSYPSLEEMQCHNDEVALKKALAKSWLSSLGAHKNEVLAEWRQKSWLPFDVLRFLLLSNRLTMRCLKGSEELLQIEGTLYQFAVLHDSPEKEVQFEKRRTENGGSCFAFHGSPAGNWFSILRNGLRALSNTQYMSTGSSHGAGIYVASHMATALGYSFQDIGWNHGRLHCRSFRVVAICEIVNGSLKSRDHSYDFMVVRPDCEQDVVIRYILVFPGDMAANPATVIHKETQLRTIKGCQTDLRHHHSHLRETCYTEQQREWQELRKARWLFLSAILKMEEEEEEGRRLQTFSDAPVLGSKSLLASFCVPGCMEAIQKELKNIMSQIIAGKKRKRQKNAGFSNIGLIHIDVPDRSNIQRWLVDLSQDLFKDAPLYQDLVLQAKQNGQPSTLVKLECVFPDAFPMAPPFIRVVSPRFSFDTGHITVGGSICMELLTESGWSPAICFESVLVQIVSAMMDGGARLDLTSSNSEYSVDLARAAFDRVARDHGWIKDI